MPKNIPELNEPIASDLKELVIARLRLIPDNVKMSVGSDGEFSRNELIESVRQENKMGHEIVRSQLEFLRALATGSLLDELNTSTEGS